MEIYDIHTHHPSPTAILNESPLGFSPQEGRYYSLGIHPWNADEDWLLAWEALQVAALCPHVLAIGEAGLDKLAPANWERQQLLFGKQAELAARVGKPLVIHCVKSANEMIGLKKKLRPSVPWIIHGFRGNPELAAQFLRHGFYLSFGKYYQEEALKSVPADRLLIETDESLTDVKQLYRKAAFLLEIPEQELTARIVRNIESLFFHR